MGLDSLKPSRVSQPRFSLATQTKGGDLVTRRTPHSLYAENSNADRKDYPLGVLLCSNSHLRIALCENNASQLKWGDRSDPFDEGCEAMVEVSRGRAALYLAIFSGRRVDFIA